MKEILKLKVQATKRKIFLEEISNLIEKEGFAQLKMQDIAKYLGISVGALYKIFASKEDLFLAYVEYQIKKFHALLKEHTKNIEDPLQCLQIYVRLKFEVFQQKRRAIEDPLMGDPFYFLKMEKRQYALIEPIHKMVASWFAKMHVHKPLKEENFLKLAYLFNSFTNGYVEYWLIHGEDLRPTKVVELFLQGVQQ
ncbi:TetR/AcrR family transcriptional regulator [Nitratiruptor sp. YY09-18]|uniref:TetR/AcrR family transcriptional regulator n=1 Tax=Nitratiruptor sp. YY09-18 TaxID=2724901 RepID=UPI001916AEC1|nr:TetR/AcrR family transcriptional regulator [Nitratiruptor sp. YY09-18]